MGWGKWLALGIGAAVVAPFTGGASLAALGAAAAGAAGAVATGAAAVGAAAAGAAGAVATGAVAAGTVAAGAVTTGAAAVGAVAAGAAGMVATGAAGTVAAISSITATEVVVAGVGVAASAAIASQGKAEAVRDAREEGMRAGNAIATAKYHQKISDLVAKLEEYNCYAQKIVGLFGVGIAVANRTGYISDEDRENLKMFVSGACFDKLPEQVKNEINRLWNEHPSYDIAVNTARERGCSAEEIENIEEIMGGHLDDTQSYVCDADHANFSHTLQ